MLFEVLCFPAGRVIVPFLRRRLQVFPMGWCYNDLKCDLMYCLTAKFVIRLYIFLFAFLVEQGWLWYLWYLSLMTLTFDILKDWEKCYSITLLRTTVFYTVSIRLLMKIDSDCVSQITGRVYFLKIFCGYLLLIWSNDSSNETFTQQLHIRE